MTICEWRQTRSRSFPNRGDEKKPEEALRQAAEALRVRVNRKIRKGL